MVEIDHPRLSIARQCELLSIARSSFYRTLCGESEINLTLMRLIDEQFLKTPWYRSRPMAHHFHRQGPSQNHPQRVRYIHSCRRTLGSVKVLSSNTGRSLPSERTRSGIRRPKSVSKHKLQRRCPPRNI
jgi:hypothetical protein